MANLNEWFEGFFGDSSVKKNKSNDGVKKIGIKRKGSIASKVIKAVIALICVIVILITGTVGYALGKVNYDEKVENEYVDTDDLYSEKGVYNILLLGVDARIKNGEEAKNSRSDSMMIVSVDTKHNCIKVVSLLRDMWVYIPFKKGSDKHQKLTAACQYGSYSGVVDTVEYNFGVDIDGYVVVNFRMFQDLVDAIGGVEMKVTKKEAKEVNNHQKRYGKVHLKSGVHTLTGRQALAYSRIRYTDSDFGRTYRQRKVIQSIISSVKSKPYKLFSVANKCAKYIETDLSKKELTKIGLATTKCIKNDMVETRVPFDGAWEYARINGNSVIQIKKKTNKKKLKKYIYDMSYEEIVEQENSKK